MARPEPAVVAWYEEATAYAVMKWPSLAAHSRASVAEALATVTPALTQPGGRGRPGPRELRTALYQHAFNPARPAEAGIAAAQILNWAQQASLPVGCLSEPAVLCAALEALTVLLDGSRAAAITVIRKRAGLHGALGYAAEAGLLPDNPLDGFGWRVPQSSAALDPAVAANPDQVSAILDAVAPTWPELTAFLGGDPDGPGPTGAGHHASCAPRGLRHRTPTADCSGEPAAGRSANRSTAAPGIPPVLSLSDPSWPPAGWPGGPTTCVTPPCHCG